MNEPPPFRILRGVAHCFFAFDVAKGIDLEECGRRLRALKQPERIRPAGQASSYFQFEPAPVRVLLDAAPTTVAGRETAGPAEAVLYDFGALSLRYTVPFSGGLDELVVLSADLSSDELLERDARRRVEALLDLVCGAVEDPEIATRVEDYLVFQIVDREPPGEPRTILEDHRQEFAQTLRAERAELSEDELADALSTHISFGPRDLTLVDWNAALVLTEDADDILAVLEFANVQLLEMRHLDDQLDRSLDRAYEALHPSRSILPTKKAGTDLHEVGRMQVDGAILFEQVSNALKLAGDQFLARLYRLAASRFHLKTWNDSILRKLDTIESIYQKMFDHASGRRLEILEWLIIVLIALGIALPFLIPHLPW
jgi:hypothetical protein